MYNIKILLEFDGTNYSGWLKQNDEQIVTVQRTVEKAVSKLVGREIEINGCSRTDAGVHAINYVVNFNVESSIPPGSFYKALNPFLPEDIKAKASYEVESDFHAVYSAKRKTYRYYFYFDETERPLFNNRAWNAAKKIDISQKEILLVTNKACSYLIGEHDFSSFKASGGLAKTSVRTIISAEVKACGENMYYLEICGDGFLYNMVRIIAGTLVGVATKRFAPDDVAAMIEAKDRKKAGVTAPPHGLYLYNVEY